MLVLSQHLGWSSTRFEAYKIKDLLQDGQVIVQIYFGIGVKDSYFVIWCHVVLYIFDIACETITIK